MNPRPIPAAGIRQLRAVSIDRPWEYISLENLVADVRCLAGALDESIVAIAGIPRSGMIPATLLATQLHLPLYELDASAGLRPLGHGLRLTNATVGGGRLLVVDDSVFGGVAMRAARGALARSQIQMRTVTAALYPRPQAVREVDLFVRAVPAPHLFEWNLFNCQQTREFAFDMDGVLCDDWTGRSEEGAEYLDFLQNARPRWLPRRSAIPLIVTARLERHRAATLDWLQRHGVRVKELVMGPWRTPAERRENYDAAGFKGRAFANSQCTLFIESDKSQAQEIYSFAQKPVLHPGSGTIFQTHMEMASH